MTVGAGRRQPQPLASRKDNRYGMMLRHNHPQGTGMKYRLLLVAAVMLLAVPVSALHATTSPVPTGLWLTQDRGGIIAINPCRDRLCARIVGVVLDHATDAMPVDYRGVSQCGLSLISDALQVGPGLWKGHILDPRDGSLYGVELRLDPHGRLALRGFLGIPLFGRTEIWTRFNGAVPPDCRMVPGRRSAAENPPRTTQSD
jgi:uncharacterized protein (DUF2147 family)